MFCKECGRNIDEYNICPYCYTHQGICIADEFIDFDSTETQAYGKHSMLVAGFLQIFLGALGIGRFYLGYTKTGLMQILASLLSMGMIGFIWGLCDGIMILNGKEKYDANGKLLV